MEQFQHLARMEAPAATFESIALCHPLDYVTEIEAASPKEGLVRLEADTTMSPGSFEAALRGPTIVALTVGNQASKTSSPARAKPATSMDQSPRSRPRNRPLFVTRTLTESSKYYS